ncbi:4'-phosphopantetheinyl transferase superfamily protein [Ensifer sp. T173]|uniref:4'-phosphopantetheinyl transferase superfamily protein n=1 Tax=Ensifer canadensis TaxID=555315 RepID=A0AAW4FRV0_9HYPH|nr:4'-phosphopantetheinyl transferase superfamily protein [Ensifer canadensis]MBM3094031.1 4'-phosphopantetheinyl transferase superfamily protein [Ensifer canadensis]UBI81059.1 4'-phosphopantetheinyl transferase superfamily protein [Ensifer canadensis]
MLSEPVITIEELGTRYVDIWLSFYDEVTDDALLAHLRSLLSEKELLQETRFHFADDRKRYLVTRALVRSVLSRYAPVHPASWEFCVNAYGRPHLSPAHGDEAQGLRFNVSHTRGLIALGVARDRDLGIDVEHLAVRDIPAGLAERWFTPEEVTELNRTERGRRQEKFFEYWTLKEAYIKARGMGLSIPLNQFSFRYPQPEIVRIAIGPELGDDPAHWAFWHYRPAVSYLLAICAERLDGVATELRIRRCVPTIGDKILALRPLRSSEPEACLYRSQAWISGPSVIDL